MANRGELTPFIKARMEAFLGRETTVAELRLLPYIGFVMVNDRAIDPKKVNREERDILALWRAAGYIEGGMSGLALTREFYDFVQDILFFGYVAYDCTGEADFNG